jgi:Cu+-exporting ATPase
MGAAFVQVTGVGSATALSQIIKLVTDAQMAAASTPIQSVADTIASYFVPTVVAVSIATTLGWYAACQFHLVPPEWYGSESAFTFSLLFGIAVLVISCPCALGLATPTAIMVRFLPVLGCSGSERALSCSNSNSFVSFSR